MLSRFAKRALEVERLIKYEFTDKRIAVEAVQMAAPMLATMQDDTFDSEGMNNNKRLSVLGDAALAKVLCSAWFAARDPSGRVLSQTQWTQLRNESLSNDALAHRGYQVGIDKCVIVADSKPAVSPKMVATTLEAVIGAVYQDGGDDAVRRVMESLGFFNHPLLTISAYLSPEFLKRGITKPP